MYRSVSTNISMLFAIMLGAMAGIAVLLIVELELKWVLAAFLAIVFFLSVMVIQNRERYFWVLFIFSLQVYVSFRILHGHSNTGGIEFPFAFVSGLMLLGYYNLSGRFSKQKKFRFGGEFSLPILLIFSTSVLSLLFTSERFVGLISLWTLFQFYVFYLVGLNCVNSKKNLSEITSLLIAVLVMQSLVFYVQAYLGVTFTLTGEVYDKGVRAGGTVGANSSIYAAFVSPLIMLVTAKLMSINEAPKKRLFWLIIITISIIAFVLTLRRGAWGGLALGFVCLLILGHRRHLLSKSWLIVGAISIVTVLVLAPAIAVFVDTYRTGNPLSSAFDERMRLNMIAWEVVKANPLLGTGPGSYPHLFKGYLSDELGKGWLYTVHNTYLLVLAETGFLGFIAFCVFLVSGYRLSKSLMDSYDNQLQQFGLAMAGSIITYSFIIYWEPMTMAFSPNALLWFLIGLMASAKNFQSEDYMKGVLAKQR